MLVAGIIGLNSVVNTTNLISFILSSTGKKVSIIDSKNLVELDSRRIKSYIHELDKNNIDILILKINMPDVEKEIFDYLNFDVMIYTDKADDFKEKDFSRYKKLMKRIFSLLDEKGTAIVNVDDVEYIDFLNYMNYNTITYGFNSKADITTSSVGDAIFAKDFMCCLQCSIPSRGGGIIEPQEYRIKLRADDVDSYNVLAAATFAIVNGIDLNLVN